MILNHLFYADVLVIISPSLKRLQKLLDICTEISNELDTIFNKTKTKVIEFKSSKYKNVKFDDVYIEKCSVEYVKCITYLGHRLNDKLEDDDGMKRQMCNIYCKGNMIISKFELHSVHKA